MRLITGDECGIIKEFVPELAVTLKQQENDAAVINKTPTITDRGIQRVSKAPPSRRRGVVALTWTNAAQDQAFAALTIDGGVEIYERSEVKSKSYGGYRKVRTAEAFSGSEIHPTTRPFSLHSLTNKLCACNAGGRVVVLDLEHSSGSPVVVEDFNARGEQAQRNSSGKISGYDASNPSAAFITASACHAAKSQIAIGGRDRDVVLTDLTTKQQVWKAKNLPPHPQTLLQPIVWPTAMVFLEDNMLAVGTGDCQVRIYDVRLQRRPVICTPTKWWDHRITAICPYSKTSMLAVADASGDVQVMDTRKIMGAVSDKKLTAPPDALCGRLVGPAGSIRQMAAHYTLPRLAMVGLDRMLRIYDTNTKKTLQTVYLKQRLNCILFGEDEEWGSIEDDNIADLEDEDIDQDDVVKDYVDSDDDADDAVQVDQSEEASSNADDGSENSSEEEVDDDTDSPDEEIDSPKKRQRRR